MRKLIFKSNLCPGDILMLTAAVRDLHLTFHGEYQTDVRTTCPAFWDNNPYITPLDENDSGVQVVEVEYPLVNECNSIPLHFIHGYRQFLCGRLGIGIKPFYFKGDIHLTEEEKNWTSQVDEVTGMPNTPFWIIVSGGKMDYTAKWWDPVRCQAVVDHFQNRILFVQCGDAGVNHMHPPLKGVIDLRGKTDLRQMTRLMYHAHGVVCPVTMFMHLAAAVETKPGVPRNRPCVVIAGGREPAHWEAYPYHQYLHRMGCLPCCDTGGCWKSRVQRLGDGAKQDDSLCLFPVQTESGGVIPKCLDMVTAEHVIDAIEQYLQYSSYAWRAVAGHAVAANEISPTKYERDPGNGCAAPGAITMKGDGPHLGRRTIQVLADGTGS